MVSHPLPVPVPSNDVTTGPVIQVHLGTILDRIEQQQARGFQELRQTLENKASKADVETVRRDFEHFKDHVDSRVTALEQTIHDEKVRDDATKENDETRKFTKRERLAVLAGAASLALTTALAIGTFVH